MRPTSPEGFDPAQWRVLVTAGLRSDWRAGGAAVGLATRRGGRGATLALLALQAVMGVVIAAVIWADRGGFSSVTIYFSFLVFTTAASVILDFHAVVLSPADYELLAHQPVSSRTFFAARLSTTLLYVLVLTAAIAAGPAIAMSGVGGLRPVRGLATLALSGLAAATTTLAMIGAYAGVVITMPGRMVRGALTALQLTVTTLLFGAVVLAPLLFEGASRARITAALFLEKRAVAYLNPGSWYAAYLEVLDGRGEALDAAAIAVSLATIGVAAVWAGRRLSLDYAGRLGTATRLAAGPDVFRAGRERLLNLLVGRGDARALAALIDAQFRFDLRFRLAVLAIVPLTMVYVVAGALQRSADSAGPRPVYWAVLMFPLMMRSALQRSDAYQAAWVFHAAPVPPARLVLALKTCIVRCFIVPYCAVLAVLFTVTGEGGPRVPVTIAFLFLSSHALLLAATVRDPQLPFSQPPATADRTADLFGVMFVTSLAAVFASPLLQLMSRSILVTVAVLAGLAGVNEVLRRALPRRIEALVAGAEFGG
jgi:hypothetical protein